MIIAGGNDPFGALQVMARALPLLGASGRRDVRARADRLDRTGLIGATVGRRFPPAAMRPDETLTRDGSGPACSRRVSLHPSGFVLQA